MQINDNLPIFPQPNKDLGKVDVGQKSTPTPVDLKTQDASVATPAASIDVSVTSHLVHAQGKKDSTALPDRVLLDKIKAKIASGTFEIDYQQISQAILHDSLAQIGSKPSK
jgi:anti-sigma28 factor (negative regulator of flagellin synthesis)